MPKKLGRNDVAPGLPAHEVMLNQDEREPVDGRSSPHETGAGLIRGRWGFPRGLKAFLGLTIGFRIRPKRKK